MNAKIALISALAPISIAVAFTFASPANAAPLADTCYGTSKSQVISCCNSWVKSNGRPIWMRFSSNCGGVAVACTGGGGGGGIRTLSVAKSVGQRCRIRQIVTIAEVNGKSGAPPGGDGGRGRGGRN